MLLAAALALAGAAAAQETAPRVLAVELANDINPVTSDYLVDAIERGEKEGYDAVVIELDTPGGLDSAMREIIKKELDADVPVVVYVSPPGSSAASAGAFITLAADVAAMAPATNIGSSTPVAVGGGEISERSPPQGHQRRRRVRARARRDARAKRRLGRAGRARRPPTSALRKRSSRTSSMS